MLDNDFPVKISVFLRANSVAETGGSGFVRASTGASHAKPEALHRHPERQADFHRLRLSAEQAQAIVAAKVAGAAIVVAVTRDGAAR